MAFLCRTRELGQFEASFCQSDLLKEVVAVDHQARESGQAVADPCQLPRLGEVVASVCQSGYFEPVVSGCFHSLKKWDEVHRF